jgi:ABC-type uncharacterized transport system substrate-binding protein
MNILIRQAPDSRFDWSCLLRAFRARFLRIGPLFWLFVSFPSFSAPFNVSVVVGGDSAPYAEIAEYITLELNRNGRGRARTVGADELAHQDRSETHAVVAVGLKAMQAAVAMESPAPVICTLIPKTSFEKTASRYKGKPDRLLSAVYLDQPVARQLELIRLALPDKKRVGVILGPDTRDLLESLQAETRAHGMRLHAGHIRSASGLFLVLEDVLSESDVLLSLPDALVFNPQTVQSVLFTSYRSRIPVIGFSPAYVRAGALVAVYSTPTQLARQVMEMLAQLAATAALPPPQYPKYFSVTANDRVARSLELAPIAEDKLAARLGAGEVKP